MIDKVLFLDIDGVLNSGQHMDTLPSGLVIAKSMRTLEPYHIEKLNRLVEKTKCEIVVTSLWRTGHTIIALQDMFKLEGFQYGILSTTLIGDNRSEEIKQWLQDHPVAKYAIVDDAEITDLKLVDNFVKTEYMTGLQDKHVDALIDILGSH